MVKGTSNEIKITRTHRSAVKKFISESVRGKSDWLIGAMTTRLANGISACSSVSEAEDGDKWRLSLSTEFCDWESLTATFWNRGEGPYKCLCASLRHNKLALPNKTDISEQVKLNPLALNWNCISMASCLHKSCFPSIVQTEGDQLQCMQN